MSKPLPEWCPRVDPNARWSERCGPLTMLDDSKRHRCQMKVGHVPRDAHVCWCHRDWKEKK